MLALGEKHSTTSGGGFSPGRSGAMRGSGGSTHRGGGAMLMDFGPGGRDSSETRSGVAGSLPGVTAGWVTLPGGLNGRGSEPMCY